MSLTNSPNWFSAPSGFYSHTIDQSLRFNSGDTAYLTKTFPASAGNQKTFTFSCWIKPSEFGSIQQPIFSAYASTTSYYVLGFDLTSFIASGDSLKVWGALSGSARVKLTTNAVFRDPSSWYNIVLAEDTTQSTASDRVKLYVNGEQITSFSTETYPSQNDLELVNGTSTVHQIGGLASGTYGEIDAYMADVNFIDGTALDPTSFGETKAGIWIPKDTSGLTFGTNGFRLEFGNSSAIGDDTSGNNFDFSTNGLAATDVVLDSPTNSWATMNPLDGNGPTISEGNLKVFGDTTFAVFEGFKSTFPMSSGKWYWEVYIDVGGFTQTGITPTTNTAVGGSTNLSYHTDAMTYESNGNKAIGTGGTGTAPTGRTTTSYGASYTDGDIIGVALDLDSATTTLTFYKNNSSQGTAFSSLANDEYVALHTGIQNNFGIFNFGQDSSFAGTKTAQGNTDDNGQGDFYYTPPSGFLACCTANLPDPGIDPAQDEEPADYFNTVLYTGTGSTRSVTGVGFQPDFVWIKDRTTAYDHHLFDVVRGGGNSLYSNDTVAENTYPTDITFASDGFSIADGSAVPQIYINKSSDAFVSWNWLAGGSASSNSDGDITASISANTKAGFSIVSFNATGSTATVGHGLNQAPEFIIAPQRTGSAWNIFAKPIGNTKRLRLDGTAAAATSGVWGNTDPTSTVFTQNVTSTTNPIIAYCFHSVDGYSKVGLYRGNGSSDGAFVHTGFRPAWVLLKRTDTTANWSILDIKRDTSNVMGSELFANLANAEQSNSSDIDFVSNGFKFRRNYTDNNSSGTYIYLAFAEQPFKYSNAR